MAYSICISCIILFLVLSLFVFLVLSLYFLFCLHLYFLYCPHLYNFISCIVFILASSCEKALIMYADNKSILTGLQFIQSTQHMFTLVLGNTYRENTR